MRGIGIDIIEIERIGNAISRNDQFLKRIFTSKEITYFEEINYRINTIAGNFAVKEAIMKALGTGLRNFKWVDIEIHRDDLGKPSVILYKNAKKIAAEQGIEEILISISHSKDYAVAQALAI
ncbi:holo-ACP synthase [Marinisporobacter balticus]|uniref:Holo-[acyl-carrier-protein] synthase n=1 Tax=Marinisporobacter balticus TaxID=2018667 RepID=A0A4R2KQG2_9FIRM|nr:holo-ACP synthase [Marinisporobacter balticus]TCO73159.1 holo-[acyl-carrier-protein] synthase [Marinisporobacter balticus]